jgi:hypothetical protein
MPLKEYGVLAGAAGDVGQGARIGHSLIDDCEQTLGFARAVL